MKKLTFLSISLLLILIVSSCTQDEFEEVKPKIENQKNRPGNSQFLFNTPVRKV